MRRGSRSTFTLHEDLSAAISRGSGMSFGRYRIETVLSFGSATDLQSFIDRESASQAVWMYASIDWPDSARGAGGRDTNGAVCAGDSVEQIVHTTAHR